MHSQEPSKSANISSLILFSLSLDKRPYLGHTLFKKSKCRFVPHVIPNPMICRLLHEFKMAIINNSGEFAINASTQVHGFIASEFFVIHCSIKLSTYIILETRCNRLLFMCHNRTSVLPYGYGRSP